MERREPTLGLGQIRIGAVAEQRRHRPELTIVACDREGAQARFGRRARLVHWLTVARQAPLEHFEVAASCRFPKLMPEGARCMLSAPSGPRAVRGLARRRATEYRLHLGPAELHAAPEHHAQGAHERPARKLERRLAVGVSRFQRRARLHEQLGALVVVAEG